MARSEAQVTLRGNNVIDVEMKYTQTGTAMLRLRLAVDKWKKSGEVWEKTNTSFFNVQLWGDLAEHSAGIVEKGMRIEVKGQMEERSWETDTGEKRYAYQLNAREVLIPIEDIESLVRVKREKRDGDGPSAPTKQTTPTPATSPFDEELDF
jgi:single-strand DNA-binding protein